MSTNTSLDKLNLLHPKIKQSAIDAYNEAVKETPVGVHPVIDQTYRSFEESNHLYQLGRTIVNPDGKSIKKPMGNIVSNSQAGQSYHNFSLALDFHLIINGKDTWDETNHNWITVVDIFKKHGFTWGGDFSGTFKDYPHLENKMGYNWRDLLDKHNKKDFIDGTEFVNI